MAVSQSRCLIWIKTTTVLIQIKHLDCDTSDSGVPVNGLQRRLGERNARLILMGLMGSRHRPLRGRRIRIVTAVAYLPVRSSPAIQKAGWSSVGNALHSAVVTRTDVWGARRSYLCKWWELRQSLPTDRGMNTRTNVRHLNDTSIPGSCMVFVSVPA